MRPEQRSIWRHFGRPILFLCLVAAVSSALSGCMGEPLLLDKIPTPTATPTHLASPTATIAPLATSTPAGAPTPRPSFTATSTVAASGGITLTGTPSPSPSSTVSATPSASPDQASTLVPAPVRLVQRGECASQEVSIGSIAANGRIVSYSGTASIAGFAYYKVEYQHIQASEWNFVARSDSPVNNGLLYAWDMSLLAPGRYRVRLTVVDVTGNYPPPCTIEVEIR